MEPTFCNLLSHSCKTLWRSPFVYWDFSWLTAVFPSTLKCKCSNDIHVLQLRHAELWLCFKSVPEHTYSQSQSRLEWHFILVSHIADYGRDKKHTKLTAAWLSVALSWAKRESLNAFYPLLGRLETVCSLIGHFKFMSQACVGIEVMEKETYFRNWSAYTRCRSPLWRLYPNCFVLVKAEGWGPGSTILKGKPAQRNEAFNFQQANQTREPWQHITTPSWTNVTMGIESFYMRASPCLCFSPSPPSRIGCQEAKTLPLGKSLGIVKVPPAPPSATFYFCAGREGFQTQHSGNLHIVRASSAALVSSSVLWSHILTNTSLLASLHPLTRISWSHSRLESESRVLGTEKREKWGSGLD